jgi:acyl carrier protein/NADH dehydrogenase (ubiquinone) 1 alpha/beta subcomplex 1
MNAHADAVARLVAGVLQLPADAIGPDASMETVATWDSLAQINICLLLQEQFGVTLDIDAIEHATSVERLAQLLDA